MVFIVFFFREQLALNENRQYSKQSVHWKGLDWKMLFLTNANSDKIGLFLAHDEISPEQRCRLHLAVQFGFVLLSNEGIVLGQSSKSVRPC